MAQDNELGGYSIVGRLAVGGMAEVFQAKPLPSTERSPGEPDEVVLKRLLPSYRNDAAFVKQFVEEAKLTTRLRHPNIVRTFKCFKAGPDYLMVQEIVPGRTLSFLQEMLAAANAAMPAEAAVYVVYCVLRALDYLHRAKATEAGANIVHRDVCPGNILLSVTGDVKLTDFGVAEVEGLMRGEAGALRGTIAYMSPEQVLGHPVDPRTDLYSAGIILWELLANRRLFTGESDAELMINVRDARVPVLSTVDSALPDYAVRTVRRALFADRDLRFQSAAEFQKALEVLAQRCGFKLTVDALRPLLSS